MSAQAHVQPTIDDLLRAAAADIAHFLTELRQFEVDDAGWYTSIRTRCQELNDRLQVAHGQVEVRRDGLRSAIDRLQEALCASGEPANSADESGFAAFQRSVRLHYDELIENLQAKRIATPETLSQIEVSREPKLLRALFHIFMGVSCVALYQFVVSRTGALILLTGFVSFFGMVEATRRFSSKINDFWVDRVFGLVARPQERHRTNSATFYMLGLAVVTVIAPKTIVCASILILAIGDPIASAIGHRWGLVRFGNGKSLGGSLAFLVSSALVVGLYLAAFSAMPLSQWAMLGLALVVTATVTELFSGRIDDNFAIPVASAVVGIAMLGIIG